MISLEDGMLIVNCITISLLMKVPLKKVFKNFVLSTQQKFKRLEKSRNKKSVKMD